MTDILCIGTSDAFGAGGRRQSAYLVRGSRGSLLLDCGGTTLTGLSTLGVPRSEIDAIVLSHFHGDHFSGLPAFLLASRFADERTAPLLIAGPEGVQERIEGASRALGHPIEAGMPFPIEFREISPERPLALEAGRVECFTTHHSPDARPHALKVHVDGRCVVYSGDTGWFDGLPELVGDADLFLCECTQVEKDYPLHLSLEEVVRHRDEFECGRVVLTHLGPEMRERSDYAGFEVADDGMVLKL